MGTIGGIDHTVVMAESLEEATLTAHRLGFRTTPPAAHPFGTANVLVQLQGGYLEFLAILDESLFPEETPDRFSFPSFNRDFLIGEGAGLSLVALKTDDPEALRERLAADGLTRGPTFSFERTALSPEGRELPVAFTLVFATHPELVRAGVFALVHRHPPENFWHAAYQAHPNTARAMRGITLVSPHIERTAEIFASITGIAPSKTAGRVEITLPDGSTLDIVDAATFERRFGSNAFSDKVLARFAAMTIEVDSLETAASTLTASGVPFETWEGAIVVAPEHAGGVGYRFISAD
ncbi:VOC family protein [Amorphus sp. 3PC139-8]|uniref:VOC family protein n=1 Tax=Amorphus sp. 3PC139-8 TaxID=2735676 RepID=UPI00345D6C91